LASFDFDQAEGLRRMLAGPKPRIVTFLSATSAEEKSAMLVNLGASLAKTGSDVLLLDANSQSQGVAAHLGIGVGATLMEVTRQERALNEAVQTMPQGFGLATLTRGRLGATAKDPAQIRRLANTFDVLARQTGMILVDGELNENDSFLIPAMASNDIVIQVSTGAASIKTAYSIIKRLNAQLGRRPFGILVTGANDKEAQIVYENMAQAASRYLAIQLNSLGSVPADEHLKRAARLGRTVVDAFPLAGASVAFRRLAGHFTSADMPLASLRSMAAYGANLRA
jgi:flagellar biosynthesis protein FlhG